MFKKTIIQVTEFYIVGVNELFKDEQYFHCPECFVIWDKDDCLKGIVLNHAIGCSRPPSNPGVP